MAALKVNGLSTPPEPIIVAAAKEFRIQIPPSYVVPNAKDWEIQYATSTNNSYFSAWQSVGKFPISQKTCTHNFTNISSSAPFYKYRYKVYTRGRQTNWSEAQYAGKPRIAAETEALIGQITETNISNEAISAPKIKANTITSAEIDTRALSSDIANIASLSADAIKGGTLALGGESLFYGKIGTTQHVPFGLSTGEPFSVSTNGQTSGWSSNYSPEGEKTYFGGTITWGQESVAIEWKAESVIPEEATISFIYTPDAFNKVKAYEINYTAAALTNLSIAASPDPDTEFESGSLVDLGEAEASSVTIQVRADGGAVTVPAGYKIEITSAEFRLREGAGVVIVKDEDGDRRISLTKNYLAYQKASNGNATTPSRVEPYTTFIADGNGVWVPKDSLTVGSTNISGLAYPQRDLSDNYCVNPTFETPRNSYSTQDKKVPENWEFFEEEGGTITKSDSLFELSSAQVPPEQGSLVQGNVLVMNPTADKACIATSEIKRIEGTSSVEGTAIESEDQNIVPFVISAFVRSSAEIQLSLRLYQSNASSYPTTGTRPSSSWLGNNPTGFTVQDTVPSSSSFIRIYTTFPIELNTANGKYIYLMLSTDSVAAKVEWDNVELYIGESITPSDSLITADLRRQITNTQSLVQAIPLNRKAVRKGLTGVIV